MSNASALINDVLLTGIPRSGTSYLCATLHKITNCVAINEPYKMSIELNKSSEPYAVVKHHLSTRANIVKKKAVQNKLLNGEVIEDTVLVEKFESYHPKVNVPNFLLCSKNTLGYLARLRQLQSMLPEIPIFACVRNPIDTIASWKQSFLHLEQGSFATQHVIGSKNDVYLSAWQKEQVIAITKEPRVAYRRAMLWTYLANWLWRNRKYITIIQYEDLVCCPNSVAKKIFESSKSSFPFSLQEELQPSTIRNNKRSLLDSDDWDAIQMICLPFYRKILNDRSIFP
ncbi:MAG: sulfotransferase [Sulfurovaceae bacterium]|nr:sulfotransferase [Sulfurovaceae bacterium]